MPGRHYEEMVTVSDTQVAWLTQEAYDRLKHELDFRVSAQVERRILALAGE